jgi:hypothetical protein
VLELFDPRYDTATRTATYEVKVLQHHERLGMSFQEQATDLAQLHPTFGAAHLFIDDCPDGVPYCHVPDGSIVGNLGSQGYCWNWDVWRCQPCNGGWDHTAALCDQTFPACQNACYTDPSLNA